MIEQGSRGTDHGRMPRLLASARTGGVNDDGVRDAGSGVRWFADVGTATRNWLSLAAVLRIGDAVWLAVAVLVAGWLTAPQVSLYVAIVAVLLLILFPRHHWRFTLSTLDDLPLLAATIGTATITVIAGIAVVDQSFQTAELAVRSLGAGLSILATMFGGRAVTFAVVRVMRRHGIGVARAVIVGAGSTGVALGNELQSGNRHGVRLVGYVDDVAAPSEGYRLLGTVGSLPNVVRDHRVDLVIIAFPANGCHTVVDPVRAIGPARCEIYVVPRLYELHSHIGTDLVNGIPLVRLRRPAIHSPSLRVKRAFDVVVATLGLLMAGPVMAVVALAVRWETGPGVIYRQQRVGIHGRLFTLYKFRSLKPIDGEDATTWSIDGDARIGPVGRFIRASSLDELPQLVNILRGDMSVVGPRPERPHFVDQFSESVAGYRYRHRMPVGLTGFAAVNGLRGDNRIAERAHYDNLYAEAWSLWFDVKIIIRTASQVARRRGGST